MVAIPNEAPNSQFSPCYIPPSYALLDNHLTMPEQDSTSEGHLLSFVFHI